MNQPPATSSLLSHFEEWLTQQILTLSVDALSQKVLTCTACPQVLGDYIIEYQGESLRLPAGKAYAFLRYVLESAA
jgi:hypothetical protein